MQVSYGTLYGVLYIYHLVHYIAYYMGSPERGLVITLSLTIILGVMAGTPPEPYHDTPVSKVILYWQLDIVQALEISLHGMECGFRSMGCIHRPYHR